MENGETIAGEYVPEPDELDDATLIERSRSDPECFAALFDRYGPRLHRYVARRHGDAVADDIVAETFLVAFRRRDGYDLARPNAGPWLYGIATNLLLKNQRAEVRRYRAFVRTAAPPEDDVANLVVGSGRRERAAAGARGRAGRPAPS